MRTAPVTRVALLSVNPWDAPGPFQPFSYAIHRVEAALRAARPELSVQVFDRGMQSTPEWVSELERFEPDLVAGSAYVWSLPTLLDIGRELKRRGARAPFVIGGPSAHPAMLALPPYRSTPDFVDALVVGEGEQTIVDLVAALDAGIALESVEGLALHRLGRWRGTGERARLELSDLPSPYRMGLVPQGVSAHVETYRGCPLSCAFCQWGEMSSRGFMSVEAMTAELEAFEALGIQSALIADAGLNLNAPAFRNLLEADDRVGFFAGKLVECELYPTRMTDGHRRFIERADAVVGIGLQSAEAQVLHDMSRLPPRAFAAFVREVSTHADVTVEIILGLPGDDPDGFRRTFDFACGLGCNVRVFHCLVLPGALMTRRPAHLEVDFHPVTLEVRAATGWTPDALERVVEEVETIAKGKSSARPAPSEHFEEHAGRPVFPRGWTLLATHRKRRAPAGIADPHPHQG